jgi:two-component system phosphate regulon sensor histidine kinase PhoR
MKSGKNIQGLKFPGVLHHKGLLLLMAIPIMIIAGFQLYWLRENFLREKKNLELRSNIIFGETIRGLQAKKLKLDKFFTDTTGKFNFEVMEGGPSQAFFQGETAAAGLLNDITINIKDSFTAKEIKEAEKNNRILLKNEKSLILPGESKTRVNIAFQKSNGSFGGDSTRDIRLERKGHPGEIIRFLYGVDSLQDSLRVKEIDSAYNSALKKEGIAVSYSISTNDSTKRSERMRPNARGPSNKITIGFVHPVTYEMNINNSFSYLLKKLTAPILFSLFLVGVTILSFVLLYRNLVRQKRLTEIKNEFISNITHELKTPIATVGVAIEALRNFNAINDPQRTKEYLDISQNELQRLSLLVDKVLKLSMFENKEIELKYEQINLKEVVDEVVSSMRLQIEKNNATVSVNQEGQANMQGDKLHLLSVVYNLLDNALKYCNGNTAIKIDLKEKENFVVMTMADNGIGISPEYKEKVFEKFFRVPAGDTHNSKGYGLGLSYVAHVVQKHKGKIEIESQPGLGTKFIITIPKTPIP